MDCSTTAIEYQGKLIVAKEALPASQLWFIAKNNDKPHAHAMSHIWYEMTNIGCDYDEQIKTRLQNDYNTNTFVNKLE